MKKKKVNAGLVLCSAITASTVGLSQVSSTATASFLGNLGQKIKEGAEATAKGTWEGIKSISDYAWKEAKIPISVGSFIGLSKLSSKLPSGTEGFLWKASKAVKDAVVSTWNSWSFGTQLVVGTTLVIALKRGYDNWKNAEIEEAIKKREDSREKVLQKALQDREYVTKLRQGSDSDAPPPLPEGYSTGSNKIYINNNSVGFDYPTYEEFVHGRRNLPHNQNNNNNN